MRTDKHPVYEQQIDRILVSADTQIAKSHEHLQLLANSQAGHARLIASTQAVIDESRDLLARFKTDDHSSM